MQTAVLIKHRMSEDVWLVVLRELENSRRTKRSEIVPEAGSSEALNLSVKSISCLTFAQRILKLRLHHLSIHISCNTPNT